MACRLALCLALALTMTAGIGAQARRLQQSDVPNFVLFSHDDRLQEETYGNAYTNILVASGARNPSGCRPPITWFINCCNNGPSSSCEWVQKAHETGHEIATHTMDHSKFTLNYTYDEWVEDITGQRDWTVNECGIPEELITGFRAPYFQVNELLGDVLADIDWVEYDSSLRGETRKADGSIPLPAGPLSASNSSGVALFVPDCNEQATLTTCDGWAGLSFWEVPAYSLPGDNTSSRSDPENLPGFTIQQRFTADFERKKGTGIPVGINVHGPYLRDLTTQAQIRDFLTAAFATPNTWGVTFQQYIAWQKAGMPSDPSELLADEPCDDS